MKYSINYIITILIFQYIESFLNIFPDIFIGNRLRKLLLKSFFKSCGKNVIINKGCHFEGVENTSIGNNCSFNRDCWLSGTGGLIISDNVIIGPKTIIHTANHMYGNPHKFIKDQGHTYKRVYIKANVWIGANVIILPGVTINENCIIGAGSVVTKDIPSNCLYAGNPAKFIKKIYE